MSKWLLRGLVFAALMVIVRLLQGAMINAWETKAGLISIVLVALFAIAVFIWGIADGRADARANPDPDRRADLAMTWLLAGLFAGIVSGVVAWFISLFYEGLYAEGLINEVTTFAAFTALLTFVAAIIGGFGSIAGALLGGYLLGALEVFIVAFLPSELSPYRDAIVFIILILVLLIRPQGILGKRDEGDL